MIRYKDGYTSTLVVTYVVYIEIKKHIVSEYISLTWGGRLTIRRGYAWDGPSGPVFNRRKVMQASLVHDAIYQLIREGLLSTSWRKTADELFRTMCIEDGVSRWAAFLYYHAVRRFGKITSKEILHAP